ncbi:hypothetical protein CYY_009675 [Polysphondylium violaceum]|uniref:Monalysin Pore-forming domain-containing protein n=1 Tax=Polysphondylium violaceum TaxID=133409 RepID=A0A8J4PMG9_9MYCE|nr:hypothetical protein CYY_009675 [Polysphondylium violaceum]
MEINKDCKVKYGNGFIVLNNEKISNGPVSSTTPSSDLKPNWKVYNLDDAQIVSTNHQIDRQVLLKTPPDSAVFIAKNHNKKIVTSIHISPPPQTLEGQVAIGIGLLVPSCNFEVYPCAAFMRYVKSYPIVGTVTQTLEKRRGFTRRFSVSLSVTLGVSAGIGGCESNLSVTTEFSQEETISTEKTESWSQTLTEGKYSVFQNALVYAFKLLDKDKFDQFKSNNKDIEFFEIKGDHYFFAPVNRNDAFTIHYSDSDNEPVEYDDLIKYLVSHPEKWN